MNDLLFYALIIALLYYFFIYLPKKNPTQTINPLTHSQATQTATDPNPAPIEDQKDLEKTLDNLIKSIQQLNKQIH